MVLYADCKTLEDASYTRVLFERASRWTWTIRERDRDAFRSELAFLLITALLWSLMHVPHMPDENILTVGLVTAEIAEKFGRRAAHGAQVTLETRLPRVPLSTFRAYVRLAHEVFPEIVGMLRGRAESYKLDVRILERCSLARGEFLRFSRWKSAKRARWKQRDTTTNMVHGEHRIQYALRIHYEMSEIKK